MSYLARAEALAEPDELAVDAATAAGRCFATGLDLDAFRGVIAVTIILGTRPVRASAWPDDVAMIEALEDLTERLGVRRSQVDRLGTETRMALDQAKRELAAAESAERSAKKDSARNAARARQRQARAVIADCTAALEILTDAAQKFGYAIRRIERVPDELGETYASVYELVRHGRVMPHRGAFLGKTA